MDSFESLKEIWLSEKACKLMDSNDINKEITEFQSKKKRNVYLLFLSSVFLLLIFILIIIFYKHNLWTTTLGEILILISVFLVLFLKLKTLKTLKKVNKNELKSNQDFLENLKISVKKKSKINRLQIFTLFLLTFGYGFFIYEQVYDSQILMLVCYIILILFVAGMYFIFKPFTEKLSRKKSERLLKNINKLSNQLYN
jgi:divalent metal cation (Fe/Co/Zn/Cd) transporter